MPLPITGPEASDDDADDAASTSDAGKCDPDADMIERTRLIV
jgi:hypothetical protein